MSIEAQFLGLTKKRAQDLAEAKSLIFRLIRIDQEDYFKYPDSKGKDIICIEIDSGKVSKAVLS